MRKFLLLIVIFSNQAFTAEKTLKVAVNIGPPWAFYKEGEGVTGIDVEIIRHIFTKHGYNTEFHLLAYKRLIKEFNEGKFDIASPAAFPSEIGYLTTNYLPFKDVVVSLKKHDLTINNISDLTGKTIIAYQYATAVLGSEFENIVKDANYLEFAEREVQLKLLVHNRTDVVIGERRLLTYINKNLFPDDELTIHPIFITRAYGAITKDKDLQLLFDKELANIKASGVYQQILNKWP
jgi:polar amino acid transport system substrate-binding protein